MVNSSQVIQMLIHPFVALSCTDCYYQDDVNFLCILCIFQLDPGLYSQALSLT